MCAPTWRWQVIIEMRFAEPLCRAVALERKAWSEPVSSGAISERGRAQVSSPTPMPSAQCINAPLLAPLSRPLKSLFSLSCIDLATP